MEKKKLDWIISIIREEMMTANSPGGSGGFGETSPAEGPTAGRSKKIKFDGRSGVARRLPPLYRTDLIKKRKKSTP
jgi:hypothetical protein